MTLINPDAPTQEEALDMQIRVQKLTLAVELAKHFAQNPNVDPTETSSTEFSDYVTSVADRIFEQFRPKLERLIS